MLLAQGNTVKLFNCMITDFLFIRHYSFLNMFFNKTLLQIWLIYYTCVLNYLKHLSCHVIFFWIPPFYIYIASIKETKKMATSLYLKKNRARVNHSDDPRPIEFPTRLSTNSMKCYDHSMKKFFRWIKSLFGSQKKK